ncbi:hypothetical protein RRG08_035498 [Elysia crispata]|uniref:Uncharacterized protein n=1 Tax=Elysia crispata TaxID=231223 RepID=A0AAE1ARJ2_9GAST|nr:hypothetical protein RRG08_035498 [Elysia crispata]
MAVIEEDRIESASCNLGRQDLNPGDLFPSLLSALSRASSLSTQPLPPSSRDPQSSSSIIRDQDQNLNKKGTSPLPSPDYPQARSELGAQVLH